jgi:hypothetical protein
LRWSHPTLSDCFLCLILVPPLSPGPSSDWSCLDLVLPASDLASLPQINKCLYP